MFKFLSQLGERHERLKERIHSFRIPLSPAGQRVMGLVYFSIPVIAGYYIMQAVTKQAEQNLGRKGEHLVKSGGASSKDTKDQNLALQAILEKHKHENEKVKQQS